MPLDEEGVEVVIEEDEVDKDLKEITDLIEKKGFVIAYDISFPRYAILPDEVALALKILKKHEMKISISLVPKLEK